MIGPFRSALDAFRRSFRQELRARLTAMLPLHQHERERGERILHVAVQLVMAHSAMIGRQAPVTPPTADLPVTPPTADLLNQLDQLTRCLSVEAQLLGLEGLSQSFRDLAGDAAREILERGEGRGPGLRLVPGSRR